MNSSTTDDPLEEVVIQDCLLQLVSVIHFPLFTMVVYSDGQKSTPFQGYWMYPFT